MIDARATLDGTVDGNAAGRDLTIDVTGTLAINDAVGAVTPLGAEATQLYALFNAMGEGGTDFSGIINFLRGKTG